MPIQVQLSEVISIKIKLLRFVSLTIGSAIAGNSSFESSSAQNIKRHRHFTDVPINEALSPAQYTEANLLNKTFLTKNAELYKTFPDNENAFFIAFRYDLAVLDNARLAQNLAETAVNRHPKWANAHMALGQIYSLQKRPEKSLVQYQIALAQQPKNQGLYLICAEDLRSLGRNKEALVCIDKALAVDGGIKNDRPSQIRLRLILNKGQNLLALKNYKEACLCLENVYKQTKNKDLRALLISTYEKEKDWSQVIRLSTEEIQCRADTRDLKRYLVRGKAYAAVGEFQKAIKDLSTYTDTASFKFLSPSLREARILKVSLYQKIGMQKEASLENAKLNSLEQEAYSDALFRTK